MDPIIDALTRLIENPEAFQGKRPAAPRAITVDLTAAPASVARLAAALASRYYHVELGAFGMFSNSDAGRIDSLGDTFRMSADNGELDLATVLPAGFDPDRTLQLGADGGGMSYLGLSWSDGAARFIVVELDDPTEDNLLQSFDTPASFLAFLDERLDGEAPPADLEALRAAAG